MILSLVAFTMVLMTISFVILNRYLKNYSIQEAEKTIFFLGQNASSLLQKPLFNADYNQLESIVQPIMLEHFDYLVIFDNSTPNIAYRMDKKNITGLFKFEKTLKNKNAYERTTRDVKGENYTHYLFPISSPGVKRPLGFLIIGVSAEKMQSKSNVITGRIILTGVLLFLALTLVIYFLSGKIVTPIKELSEKIGAFASGNYSVRSHIKTNDEIGDLSDSFNIMADQINEQILSIEVYSKNLEDMVGERTDELLKALDAIKEKDRKLNQVEKIHSLNTIVSSIAHEINNPLAIISGNFQLIEAKLDASAAAANYRDSFKKKLEVVHDAVQRIATLIDDINFFSAIKNITTMPCSFSNVLANVVGDVVPANISVHIDGIENDRIISNAHLLTTSMENILNNSVQMIQHKNIGSNGQIDIRYFREDLFFVIEIVDNGGGFEDAKKVFEPFYTTFGQKKGLGLTFVYHAIQALNGEFIVENVEGENGEKGAKVTIMLPLEE